MATLQERQAKKLASVIESQILADVNSSKLRDLEISWTELIEAGDDWIEINDGQAVEASSPLFIFEDMTVKIRYGTYFKLQNCNEFVAAIEYDYNWKHPNGGTNGYRVCRYLTSGGEVFETI